LRDIAICTLSPFGSGRRSLTVSKSIADMIAPDDLRIAACEQGHAATGLVAAFSAGFVDLD
jgi:hypothetical protein